MKEVLSQEFFNRDTQTVAKELLGKFLVRRLHGKEIAGMITDTEAYDGFHDLASPASKGRTKRTEVMFGHPGNFYVYLCYGVYFMLNVVTREHGYPAAILIRGIKNEDYHVDGPGKVTKFLKIGKTLNKKIADQTTGLWFEDRGVVVPSQRIKKMARVGVAYAGPVWSAKKWRFVLK